MGRCYAVWVEGFCKRIRFGEYTDIKEVLNVIKVLDEFYINLEEWPYLHRVVIEFFGKKSGEAEKNEQ